MNPFFGNNCIATKFVTNILFEDVELLLLRPQHPRINQVVLEVTSYSPIAYKTF